MNTAHFVLHVHGTKFACSAAFGNCRWHHIRQLPEILHRFNGKRRGIMAGLWGTFSTRNGGWSFTPDI